MSGCHPPNSTASRPRHGGPGHDHEHDYNGRSIPDVVVHLTRGLHPAECVNVDGTVGLWLLVDGCTCGPEDPGCDCADCAPHEQVGWLSAEVRLRMGLRCPWVNPRSGKQCRASVVKQGASWDKHAGTVTACTQVFRDGRRCNAWTNRSDGLCRSCGIHACGSQRRGEVNDR
jgi:hypothetical protein